MVDVENEYFVMDGLLEYTTSIVSHIFCIISLKHLHKQNSIAKNKSFYFTSLQADVIFGSSVIGEVAKQARHSQVCSIENRDIL